MSADQQVGSGRTGVMGADYATGRIEAPHLGYRLRVRARVAAAALMKRRGQHSSCRVLELGAAEGLTLLEIRRLLGGEGVYDGIELSQELLGAAPPVPENVRLIHGDVMSLPGELVAGSYDLCTLLAVLEHLPDPERCLQEAHRMLRPGGVLVLTCPNPSWDAVAGRLRMVAEEHHEQKIDGKQMCALARGAGFRDVTFEPFMWAPLGVLPYLRVRLDPGLSLTLDRAIRSLRLLNFGFVNQAVVAQRR